MNVYGDQKKVSKNLDSIYISGHTNDITVNLKNTKDSIEFRLIDQHKKFIKSPFPYIRYTNLNGGEYDLKFREVSKPNYHTIHISIEEALWQKWWFIPMVLSYILLIAGILIYFFNLYNYRQKLKTEAIRNKIAADLHDEVGSNLSSIAIFSDVLRKKINLNQNPDTAKILEKIKENSRESVSLLQDTVWSLNPENDKFEKLLTRIDSFARQLFLAKNIAYVYDCNIDTDSVQLDMEAKKNLFLILKEAINNVAKHSEATKSIFSISKTKDNIKVSVIDNGKGFDIEQNWEGNGLKNYKIRTEESGFELELKSNKSIGTELNLYI